MMPIAIAFVINALWLILSPWALSTTLNLTIVVTIYCLLIFCYTLIKRYANFAAILLLSSIGIILSTYFYLPALKDYQTISLNLPATINATFKIERNHYPESTTIEILTSKTAINNTKTDPPIQIDKTADHLLNSALKSSTLQIFNIPSAVKETLIEGEIYQGIISIRARFHKNIPGDRQRILQSLARKEIGYGKFESKIKLVQPSPKIEVFRQETARNFTSNFRFGNYLSALSIGITQYLTTTDWDNLRKTGTIHLVSISGLHLSLTAFYAFIIFRVTSGLLGIRRITPYKIAALLSIIVAWQYAVIAGLSLPTTRAAIMFTIAMLALLTNRPIFSLHGVSIALVIILAITPLSILLPGFWLSFVAVIILILSARIFTSPLKALLLTQLIISLLLIPLTASFFGEVSLISPLINLFAIPWTTMVIMPFLLLGTIFLLIHPQTANFFNSIADQGVFVLTKSIEWSAQVPYASIKVSRLHLAIAVLFTFITLCILYFYPLRIIFKAHYQLLLRSIQRFFIHKITLYQLPQRIPLRSIFIVNIIIILIISQIPISSSKYKLNSANKQEIIQTKNYFPTEAVHLYLLPVGEGLSLLFHSKELTFLFDTGNRFRQFDAGKQVIIPTLKALGIHQLNQIFLSLQNQQHIGGTRMVRTKYPSTSIIAHPQLLWLIENAQDCRQYHYDSAAIKIEHLVMIESSCAFHIQLFNQISLYLLSDITDEEWLLLKDQNIFWEPENITQQIILFPNQGQRFFPLDPLQKQSHLEQVLLFSTRKLSTKLQNLLMITPRFKNYNAYYGAVHLTTNTKNAKSSSKLRIEHYADTARYWWLQPSIP